MKKVLFLLLVAMIAVSLMAEDFTITSFDSYRDSWNTEMEGVPANSTKVLEDMKPIRRDIESEVVFGADNLFFVFVTDFSAQYLINGFVQINWTVESECNMYGYRLYRSQSDLENIDFISEIIYPTNNPQTHSYSYQDYGIEVDETYYYWLEDIDMDGLSFLHGPVEVTIVGDTSVEITTVGEGVPELPTVSVLKGNYPNPFNPVTNIKLDVKDGETAELTIYNAKGQMVESERFVAVPGGHTYSWDASQNSSGVYFYRLRTESYNSVKKMIMIK